MPTPPTGPLPAASGAESPVPEVIQPYMPWVIDMAQGLLLCIAILFVGWVASKWARGTVTRWVSKTRDDVALSKFLGGIAQYTVLVAAAVAALGAVGIETTSLVAVLGTAGLATGMALQGNLAHFASGVMILFFRPFNLGDIITAGGQTGGVVDIGLFATTMQTPENIRIIVPNGSITSGSIVNYTALGTRRGTVEVGVAYGADTRVIEAALLRAAASADLVVNTPHPPAVAFVGLGASSLDFQVHCFSEADMGSWLGMLHNVRTAIYNELNAAGIDIPYNQIVIHKAG